MVHVLSCDQFTGYPKTITSSQDPLTIFASPGKLFVGTLQHSINVYGLDNNDTTSNGTTTSSSSNQCGSLLHSFTTAGIVKQGVYSPTGNYIATLEMRNNSCPNPTTSIRVYFNWETSGPHLAVRARVAGGDLAVRTRGATVPAYSLDREHRSRNQFELVEVQTPTPASCIGCCPATGNLAAGIEKSVVIYRFVTENKGTTSECVDFEHIMEVRIGLLAREIALNEGTVACMGTQEIQAFKIRLWDTALTEASRGRSLTETEISRARPGHRRVPRLIKPRAASPPLAATTPGAGVDTSSAKKRSKGRGKGHHGKGSEFYRSQPYYVVDVDAATCWDFGIEATTISAGKTKSTPPTADDKTSTVLFPTIQSEEPYYENSGESCELIGPVGRIQGHPTHIKLTKKPFSKMKCSLTQLLYRRFPDLTSSEGTEGHDYSTLHSLQLFCTYGSSASSGVTTEPGNDIMEGENAHNLAGMCCFFSSSKEGHLYEMQPRPRLLSEYVYKADALQVCVGRTLLFALTQNGLETYTLHAVAAALPNMEATDSITNTCPLGTIEVSLVGLEPYLGLTQLAVSRNHVMLLSKARDVHSQSVPSKSDVNTNIATTSSTIYIHARAPSATIYRSLIELGERYRQSSLAAYLQCLLEGHLLLRSALCVVDDANVAERLDSETEDELRTLYLQSCFHLALHYCRGETENWHLALPYFNMSRLPLQEIIKLCPKPFTAFEDKELMTGAGSGMIHYLDWVLFDETSTVEVDQATSDKILRYFVSLCPQHCSKVILFSKIADRLSPDKALSVLTKVRDTHQPGQHVQFAGGPTRYCWGNLDRFAMSSVYLRLGDFEQAATTLCTLSGEEITQLCTQHSDLLLQADGQFSHLAQLIRQQEPESLLSALVQLIDDSTVSLETCIHLLRDESEQLSSPANSHLKRFLEAVVFTKHRHNVLPGAAEILLGVYFQRLEGGMSKGVPLRQSSRHTHMFAGGGCFHKTAEWMDYLPPFQGPDSLTFKCLQAAGGATNQRPPRGFLGRLPGKVGGGQRSSSSSQLRSGAAAATGGSGKQEEETVCPCCCCNDDLLKMQSLIASPCAVPSMVTQVQQLLAEAASRDVPTTQCFSQSCQSLSLVCLAASDSSAVLDHLVQHHPEIVLDYAQDTFGTDQAKWKNLLRNLLEAAPQSMEAEVDGTGSDLSSGNVDYLQILTGVLGHASNLMTPEELLQCLPNEGSLSFFLPYLRQSCCRQNARLLHQQLIETLAT